MILFRARFEADSGGVYVRPPEYKSRLRWVIPLAIALAICFPFVATKYLLTVAILGLIYVLLGLGHKAPAAPPETAPRR